MRLKWKLNSVRLESVLILTQIGAWFALNVPLAWKSFWTQPMDLLGDLDQVESRFIPFGYNVSADAR